MTEKKRLYRSRNSRMIAGVCGGLAEYFNIDVTLIRLVFVVAAILYGHGLLAYLICLILIPLEPDSQPVEVTEVVSEPNVGGSEVSKSTGVPSEATETPKTK